MKIVTSYNGTEDRYELDSNEWEHVATAGQAILNSKAKLSAYNKDIWVSIIGYADPSDQRSITAKQVKFINDQLDKHDYNLLEIDGVPFSMASLPESDPLNTWMPSVTVIEGSRIPKHNVFNTSGREMLNRIRGDYEANPVKGFGKESAQGNRPEIYATEDDRIHCLEVEVRTLASLVAKLIHAHNNPPQL